MWPEIILDFANGQGNGGGGDGGKWEFWICGKVKISKGERTYREENLK